MQMHTGKRHSNACAGGKDPRWHQDLTIGLVPTLIPSRFCLPGRTLCTIAGERMKDEDVETTQVKCKQNGNSNRNTN